MAYLFQLARSAQEYQSYFQLRHDIFVAEQGLFPVHDVDSIDHHAYPIVAMLPETQQVVGVVRIYETEPNLWYGGRLGTHQDYRKGWQIGKGLIYKAVTTAHAWGCTQFLATVQLQNVRFFQRLHWHSLQEIMICERPHHLMQADLSYYPPCVESRPSQPLWLPALEAS